MCPGVGQQPPWRQPAVDVLKTALYCSLRTGKLKRENNGLGQQARPGMVIRASESVRRSLLSCLFSGEADPAAVHTLHRTLTGPFNDCLLLFGGW